MTSSNGLSILIGPAALSLALAVGIAALSSTASAASFDCAKATSPYDKLICADKGLSAADEQMAQAYATARSQLSEEGKHRLVESQRSWLKFLRDDCPVDIECLKDRYVKRIFLLQDSIRSVGPFRIQSVEEYAVEKAKPGAAASQGQDEDEPGTTSIITFYQRIDDPASPETRRWNALMEQRITKFLAGLNKPESGELSTYFQVDYASTTVISATLSWEIYSGLQAHLAGGATGFTVLPQAGRELQPEDLFNREKPWKEFLAQHVFDALQRNARDEKWDLDIENPDDLTKMVTDIGHWRVTREGLAMRFNQYEVAAYVFGPREVTISWHDLQPYLTKPPPFLVPPP
jgi:uncharacterized protein